MKKITMALLILLLAGSANFANALSIYMQSASQSVSLNDHAIFNVNVSGASGLGAYDITLLFNQLTFAAPTIIFGSYLGAPGESFVDAIFSNGSVNIAETSFLWDLSLQPADFTLFTLDFLATDVGVSLIAFGPISLSDPIGNTILDVTTTAASITVEPGVAPIPEPGTILLVCAGLASLAIWRRRQNR